MGAVVKRWRPQRAARLVEPGHFMLIEQARPEPKEGQVLLRLQGCGLCASNLPPFEGRPWFEYPFEPGGPGHEGWGIIEALGPGVQGLEVGQPVAALSYHAFADYDLARADSVVPLPEELSEVPFPGEPLGCAMNIFERSQISAGQKVVILGAGFLGCLLTALASHQGAEVIGISRRSSSLEMACRFGAQHLVELDDHHRVIDQVMELTGGDGCDRVIECTGLEWPLNLAGELTKVRGRLVIAGFHQGGMRSVNIQLWNWRGLDVINAHERDPARYVDGIRRAVQAVQEGILDPTPLYTHRFGLSELDRAFQTALERPEGFMKTLIMMDE